MRTASLAAALAAGALLAACSKPEPAAGAPSPEVMAVDSATTNAMPDSTMSAPADTAAMADTTAMVDTTMTDTTMADTTAMVDTTSTN